MADEFTEKEKGYMKKLNKNGQVIVDDLKELEKFAKKLEKIYGKGDPPIISE